MFGTALLGYTGSTVADAANAGLTIDIVSAPKPGHRFIVQQRRWVVEPTKLDQPPVSWTATTKSLLPPTKGS